MNTKTLTVNMSENDYQKYKFGGGIINFNELKEIINREYIRNVLIECNNIADDVGLSNMTLDEINAEIKAVRDDKNNS